MGTAQVRIIIKGHNTGVVIQNKNMSLKSKVEWSLKYNNKSL